MLKPFEPRPCALEGSHAAVVPLGEAHAADLFSAGGDAAIWTYMPRPALRSVEDAASMIRQAWADAKNGSELPFAIVERASGRAVGSTRFLDIQRAHRALEIGWTWIGAPWQRTPINTECKLLLLTHAFDDLGVHRVTLKTDARNERSQRAIERIGATREGVVRRHRICWDGSVRDSVYYGIVDEEWPRVRASLAAMAARR
jgi:RimJ/RimL family protein N-acetyltransferase